MSVDVGEAKKEAAVPPAVLEEMRACNQWCGSDSHTYSQAQ